MEFYGAQLEKIVEPLLAWYKAHARALPWRGDPAPYRVWVSEIMLQQTRVEAVKEAFERFVRELPDIRALAEASDERLMKLWEGLGYYSRARNLQKAARIVMTQHKGKLPASYGELKALPGIGDYTAGAIASIAFGQSHPAVDGNVLRVLARLRASTEDIALPQTKRAAEGALRGIMPAGETSDFTQAMMELGAVVCLPNGAPLCGGCPLRALCAGHARGIQSELPVKAKKRPRRAEERTVLLIVREGKLALRRRPEKGLLAGMWELPALDGFCGEREARARLEAQGVRSLNIRPLKSAKHIFTHVEWRMKGYLVLAGETGKGFVWADRTELAERYAVPSAFRSFIGQFAEPSSE